MVKPQDKERLARKAYELGYYHESHERACSQSQMTVGFVNLNRFKSGRAIMKGCDRSFS